MSSSSIGTAEQPLRVAIIGSGPAAFYAAEYLLKQPNLTVQVDMLDRLPTPYGLVRGGVAPDHQKIKSVIRIYEQVAKLPGFRFFGNVEFGRDVTQDDVAAHFHQVVFATGAQTDRRLGIPGEELAGVHSATEFVAWYNAHPDFRDRRFDLATPRAAIIGVGNVAIDVARILLLPHAERCATDMADHALEVLCDSAVCDVTMLGRRGPAQAAFTNLEIRELGERIDADVVVDPKDLELDAASAAEVERGGRIAKDKLDILRAYADRAPAGKPGRLAIRFNVSPVGLVGDARGHVAALRIERNALVADADGRVTPRGTGEIEELPVGLVFRSVGYQGVALPGVPFDARRCVVPNDHGRIVDATGAAVAGCYVSGWIKRGPSGVIGTNKKDATETVELLLDDARAGRLPQRGDGSLEDLLAERGADAVMYAGWQAIDEAERTAGEPHGRPRIKLRSWDALLDAARRS